jgi:hypothetical protein
VNQLFWSFRMSLLRTLALCFSAVALAACVEQPSAPVAATDCVKVAHWVDLGLKAETLINDTAQDETYNSIVAERKSVAAAMSAHDLRFGSTLISQLQTRATSPYADIYGLCRKWETGNY